MTLWFLAKQENELEIVKTKFLKVLPTLISKCVSVVDFSVFDNLIEAMQHLVETSQSLETKKVIGESIVQLFSFLPDEKKESLLTILIFLANDEENEDNRVLAATLFSQISSFLSKELMDMFVIPQFQSLIEDPDSKVRKTVASHFKQLIETQESSLVEQFFVEIYQVLADDSLWTVRKAATDVLPVISAKVTNLEIKQQLLDILMKFAKDSQHYVRISAMEVLGKFLDTLPHEMLVADITEFYTKTVSEINDDEEDLLYKAAFNLPAILYFMRDWDSLKGVYEKLMNCDLEKVNISLSSSIGEVASLVVDSESDSVILNALEKLKRKGGVILNNCVANLSKVLSKVSEVNKIAYYSNVCGLFKKRNNWREDIEASNILLDFVPLYGAEFVRSVALPFVIKLTQSKVAEVRNKAVKLLARMFNEKMVEDPEILMNFGLSDRFRNRQVFIHVFFLLADQTYFENCLVNCAKDEVMDVKVSLCLEILKSKNKTTAIKFCESELSKEKLTIFEAMVEVKVDFEWSHLSKDRNDDAIRSLVGLLG